MYFLDLEKAFDYNPMVPYRGCCVSQGVQPIVMRNPVPWSVLPAISLTCFYWVLDSLRAALCHDSVQTFYGQNIEVWPSGERLPAW